jgi:putative phosphoribosyl transferase
MQFQDRREAGRLLAERCARIGLKDPIVLALPRGGVPVAFELAQRLRAPLDVLVVRKIGAPGHMELGVGAATENDHYWIDDSLARYAGASTAQVEKIAKEERKEVERRVLRYRRNRPLPDLRKRNIILVDDGLATGVTARVGAAYLKSMGAERVILAVPVCSPSSAEKFEGLAELVCLETPPHFMAVGQFYKNFEQTSDEEVLDLLDQAGTGLENHPSRNEVAISDGEITLPGTLVLPPSAVGIVVFAHGSGSSRFSPRNQKVARHLNEAGLGTLLFDLLGEEEAADRRRVFDIPLLAKRLELAIRWLRGRDELNLPLGLFGASTGAAAALWAAADLGNAISALVSRGGRPDLALARLPEVNAPTLLLVGSEDEPVISMNQEAMAQLRFGKLVIIPGAGHLFEEPGTLEEVERQAASWFLRHLGEGRARASA